MSRIAELLAAAAAQFEQLSDPFAREWLVEHQVTLDECGDLSEHIALAIRVYLSMPAPLLATSIAKAVLAADLRRLTT